MKSTYLCWLLPLAILVIVTPFSSYLDLAFSSYFYQGDGQFSTYPLFTALYNYGTYPAWICAGAALILLLWKIARPYALVFLLTFSIGAGVIVNGLFKEQWGRPRPKQTTVFGGTQPFRSYYLPQIGNPQPSKSFSCGHCTMGFVFFALALVAKRKGSPPLFCLGMVLALTLGLGLSLARIAQGGHYFSDTLVSAIIMWWTAFGCCRLVLGKEVPSRIMTLANR